MMQKKDCVVISMFYKWAEFKWQGKERFKIALEKKEDRLIFDN